MHILDRLVALAVPRRSYFREGWGDEQVLDAYVRPRILGPPPPIELAWGTTRRQGSLTVRDGAFVDEDERLPSEVRLGRVRELAPARGERRGTLLLLAAHGDQGFATRTSFVRPLVEKGLAALLLEVPFYGHRRRRGGRGIAPGTVSDLVVMGSATTQEARALLARLREEGAGPLGVAGYSMGGNMAAAVAASVPFEVAAIPMAPSCSPAHVFTEGALRSLVDLRALGKREGPDAARATLAARLSAFDVTRLPPPRAPRAAIVVGTRLDGFVPPSDAERLARHWGAELRWLEAGHVTAITFHQAEMRRAVEDAFARLA